MKSVLPKSKMEWIQLVLFPFKFCIFLIPVVFIILEIERGAIHVEVLISDQIINLMVVGDIVCIIILAIGGIVAAILMRNWKLMRSGLIYAGIGLFLLFMLILPSLAAPRL